jgi:hypothetical protein
VVRLCNAVDDDHTGPAVEVVWPVYLRGERAKIQVPEGWEPEPYRIDGDGLTVKVDARDRSGVARVDVYLNWANLVRVEKPTSAGLYEFTIPKDKLPPEVYTVHAVACDTLGNENGSFSVPFRVAEN